MTKRAPVLDSRDAATVVEGLVRRLPGYLPELSGSPAGPAWALLQILGRYSHVLLECVNQAPDKNKLAFLDLLGINLLPAQAARAPVVFEPLPNIGDSQIPAGTRVGAKSPGQADPLVFETERGIALATAKLVEAVTIQPALDAYSSHTEAIAGGVAFQLFGSPKPIRHELCLAQDTLLALSGNWTVDLEFDLASPGAAPVETAWSFWNGEAWQTATHQDATLGLTRSGTIRLSANDATAQRTSINGVEAYWLRGVITAPLSPRAIAAPASVEGIRIRSKMSRPLSFACKSGVAADAAYAESTKLDLTKTFFPLGRAADHNSAFYFSSEEVFSKPGAEARLCFRRVPTPEEEADKIAAENLASKALDLEIEAAKLIGQLAADAAGSLHKLATEVADFETDDPPVLVLGAHIQALRSAAAGVSNLTDMQNLAILLSVTTPLMVPLMDSEEDDIEEAGPIYASAVNHAIQIAENVKELAPLLTAALQPQLLVVAQSAAQLVVTLGQAMVEAIDDAFFFNYPYQLAEKIELLKTAMIGFIDFNGIDVILQPAKDVLSELNAVVAEEPDVEYEILYNALLGAVAVATSLLPPYTNLAGSDGSGTVDPNAMELEPPRLIWEYWSGETWKTLLAPDPASARNFTGSGTIKFVVPDDFGVTTIQGQSGRWVRVRLQSGSYNLLKFVSWNDQVTGSVSSMAILQPRPPALEGFFLGYQYESELESAQRCVTYNDFAYVDRTTAAKWGGSPFEAFHPIADATAALYLGFDKPLPADFLGIYFDIRERKNHVDGPEVEWEFRNGSTWAALNAEDDTHGLSLPGMVSIVWPGITSKPLARFSESRTWIRARLREAIDPLKINIAAIAMNAVWAANLQTIETEVLGSSRGQPNEVFFFRHTPVIDGDSFEVRELDGARAEVELPMLREELLNAGLTDADIRVTHDPQTGKVREVWVRWQVRPNLLFSDSTDRESTIERTRGRLILGDDRHGRIPVAATDNIRASRYRHGGGLAGNVPKDALTQLLSGVTAKGVTNPRGGEGGADGETVAGVLVRGPRVIRHRYRAVSREDYEDLAREASPGVAVARALPATHSNGRHAPGWVTVIIVPQSRDPRPQPSFELRRRVREYLAERAPASLTGVEVIGPTYLPVGVEATLTPRDPEQSKVVLEAAHAALSAFLHPLTGGPDGEGWPFGRDVYISDVAVVIEAVEGVDYASQLDLLLQGAPWGEHVAVPTDRIVVAGPLRLSLRGKQ